MAAVWKEEYDDGWRGALGQVGLGPIVFVSMAVMMSSLEGKPRYQGGRMVYLSDLKIDV